MHSLIVGSLVPGAGLGAADASCALRRANAPPSNINERRQYNIHIIPLTT
jgi:hypothetical protein